MTEPAATVTTTRRPALQARTVLAPLDGELLDRAVPDGFTWLRDGSGFVAGGVAAHVPARDAAAYLQDIEVHDEVHRPGTGAIAVGSLPFLDTSSATVTIPAWVEGRAPDGTSWRTEIGGPDASFSPPARAVVPPMTSPGTTRTRCLTSREYWDRAVTAVLTAIGAGDVTKVVLARTVQVEAARAIDPRWLLGRLQAREPGRYLFAHAGSVGASPELLVSRTGRDVLARPLAGTVPWPAEEHAIEALMQSGKQQREHAIVVNAMAATLSALCSDLDVGAPVALRLADVAHIATTVGAHAGPDTPSALGLALALHPTPAVGGTPTDRALEYIARAEPHGRGRFAGPVGWVDAQGDGEIAVALRSAEIDGPTALVRAGAGIVAGSNPQAEWDEIDAKLTPMLRALTNH